MKRLHEMFLLHTQSICLKGAKLIIIILGGVGGGVYIFLCLLPYNSNFPYFEIKSLVPRTSNLQDLINALDSDLGCTKRVT